MKHYILAVILLFASSVSCNPKVPVATQAALTATPTEVPTASPVPLPNITANAWASGSTTGNVDPAKMYLVVGAINHKHHFTLDFNFGTMRLAMVTDNDLTQMVNQKELRERMAIALDQNDELKHRLVAIGEKLTKEFTSLKDFRGFVVVIENDKPTHVTLISSSTSRFVRFSVNENGNLVRLSAEDFQLLPKLVIEGKAIVRLDTNEVVKLAGMTVMAPTHTCGYEEIQWVYTEKYIDIAKSWGANLIQFQFAAQRVLTEGMIDKIVNIVDYAESKGIYVMFTGASDKAVPSQCLYNDTGMPNDNAEKAFDLLARSLEARTNVIFDIWNEPDVGATYHPNWGVDKAPDGTWDWERYFWEQYLAVTKQIIENIRYNIGSDAIVTVSGIGWGTQFDNDEFMQLNEQYSNILYRIQHIPGTWRMRDPSQYQDNTSKTLDRLVKDQSHAVVIAEYDLIPPQGENSDFPYSYNDWRTVEEQWMNNAIEYAGENNLGTIGFMMGQSWLLDIPVQFGANPGPDPLAIPLTERGKLVKNGLSKYPPYQFDR